MKTRKKDTTITVSDEARLELNRQKDQFNSKNPERRLSNQDSFLRVLLKMKKRGE